MKRKSISILVAIVVFLLCLPVAAEMASAQSEYAWVLTEIVDYEYADRWAKADAHASYKVSNSYSQGTYSASHTYEGDDKDRHGTLGLKAVFSGVPEIIYADKPVILELSFSTTENSVVKLSFSGSASADFDQWDVGSGSRTGGSQDFVNKDDEDTFTISALNGPSSYSETLTAQLSPGSEGSRIALRTKFSMGAPMGTNYVYEWKPVGEVIPTSEPMPEQTSTPTEESTLTITPKQNIPIENNHEFWKRWGEQAKKWTPEDIEEAKKRSRVVRVGDTTGEVWVLRGWEEDIDAAIYVDFNTPLYHGDLIITKPKSGIILSFSDMTSFVMKEDSAIVLDIKQEKQTKIGFIAGKIWANINKMVEDGSMEVEMAQAVAGIKGTTFICEENNGESILKVLEGTVEYTAKADGKTVMVSDGQMNIATSTGAGQVIAFDVDNEMKNWDENTQELTAKALHDAEGNFPSAVIVIVAVLLLFSSVLVAVFVKRRRK